ncbi:unnamed protein product [Cunninghamella blakesleeana]
MKIWLGYLFCNLLIILIQGESKIISRKYPACTLVHHTIYCFGGTKVIETSSIGNPFLNDHIALDLTQFQKGFTQFNRSNIQWKTLSNKINYKNGTKELLFEFYALSTPLLSLSSSGNNNGGYLLYSKGNLGLNEEQDHPLIKYDIHLNKWFPIPLPSGYNYSTSQDSLINLGNDTFWIWEGETPKKDGQYVINIFNYLTNTWATYYTKNFASDKSGIIPAFDTLSSEWVDIKYTGDKITYKSYHTVTEYPDKDLLIVFGGLFSSNDKIYLLFDIKTNVTKYVTIPLLVDENNISSYENTNERYGHYATLYDSNYLVLIFGFKVENVAADHVSILNVANPFAPFWVTENMMSIDHNNNNTDPLIKHGSIDWEEKNNSHERLSKTAFVVVVTVPLLITIILFIVGIILIRQRINEQRKIKTLEKEDPRLQYKEKLELNLSSTSLLSSDHPSTKPIIKPFDIQPKGGLCKPSLIHLDSDSTLLSSNSNSTSLTTDSNKMLLY